VGLRRGRPILVAARTPDSVGYCEGIGLDLERWMRQGLIDIWVPGGYFQLTHWEESVRWGHRYGIMVYPSLSESWMGGDAGARAARDGLESYRARAMNVWNSGADGVYMFNYFNPNSPLWREVGDPEGLQKLNKVYYVTVTGFGLVNDYLPGAERFYKLPTLSPERPETLKAGETLEVPLAVGENVLWGKPEGIVPDVTLSVHQVDKLATAADVSVTLNGQALGEGIANKGWLLN